MCSHDLFCLRRIIKTLYQFVYKGGTHTLKLHRVARKQIVIVNVYTGLEVNDCQRLSRTVSFDVININSLSMARAEVGGIWQN